VPGSEYWSAGYAGLYQASTSTGALQLYDDVKIGYDENGDGDILDAGDEIQVADSFDSNVVSLSYDNNGNLTNDGVYQYVYDGWNRLVQVQRKAAHSGQADDVTTIATYAYLADNRRASKLVEHCGLPHVANDGGDQTVHFYYGGMPGASGGVTRWNIFETRDGSNTPLQQWVWGTQYVDELLCMDVNDTHGAGTDCDPDHGAQGESGQDRRYFYHQDRNWNVIALTEYDDGAGTNGRIAERYAYTPYGEFLVLKGDAGSGELGQTLVASGVGNLFFHQGLCFDHERGGYQNRHREYAARMQQFAQRDPYAFVRVRFYPSWHYRDGADLYEYVHGTPAARVDPDGLGLCQCMFKGNIGELRVDCSCRGVLSMWVIPESVGNPAFTPVQCGTWYQADGYVIGGTIHKIDGSTCIELSCSGGSVNSYCCVNIIAACLGKKCPYTVPPGTFGNEPPPGVPAQPVY